MNASQICLSKGRAMMCRDDCPVIAANRWRSGVFA
jgi:hypothetical protein